MATSEYNEMMKLLRELPEKEQAKIVKSIMTMLGSSACGKLNTCDNLVKEHTCKNEKPDCPHCKASASLGFIMKRGFNKGVQRYHCKACGKFFTATTNTVFEHTHKSADTWEKFISLTLAGKSIKACADECHLAIQTAFNWRHKVLNAFCVHQNSVQMSGKIEMDEMLIPISYKGNHIKGSFNDARKRAPGVSNNLPRKSYQRGSDNRSASSKDKACVCCMIRNGNEGFYAAVPGVGFMLPNMLEKTVSKHINKDNSLVIVDTYKVTTKYLSDNNYKYMALLSNTSDNTRDHKPEIKDGYHLQHVNSFHYHLRKFLAKYCGVSTKYLENYVSLYVWIKNLSALKQKKHINKLSVTRASNADCYITQKALDAMPAVPMCA